MLLSLFCLQHNTRDGANAKMIKLEHPNEKEHIAAAAARSSNHYSPRSVGGDDEESLLRTALRDGTTMSSSHVSYNGLVL